MGEYWTRLCFALGMLCSVSACGNLIELPGQGPAPQIYNLTASQNSAGEQGATEWRLLVEEPDASRAIDTDRIAVRLSPVEISYYEGARWSDRAPRLMQSLLIESLDNSGALQHVCRTGTGINAQYAVKTNLLAFYAEAGSARPTVVVKMKLTLLNRSKAQIIASRIIEASKAAEGRETKEVILAFNEAAGEVLRNAVAWTISTLETGPGGSPGS